MLTDDATEQLRIRAERLIADEDAGHSDYQIERFIVAKAGPHPYGMLKQARREIRGRLDALRPPRVTWWRRIFRRRRRRPRSPRSEQTVRELRCLVRIAEELEAQLGTTLQHPQSLEGFMWLARIRRMVVIEFLGTGRISPSLLETIAVMPDGDRDMIVRDLDRAARVTSPRGAIEFIGSLPALPCGLGDEDRTTLGTPPDGASNGLRGRAGRGSNTPRSDDGR